MINVNGIDNERILQLKHVVEDYCSRIATRNYCIHGEEHSANYGGIINREKALNTVRD